MLSVLFSECPLCWVSFLLSVIYAECHKKPLCWASLCLMLLCWVSLCCASCMLSVIMLCVILLSVVAPTLKLISFTILILHAKLIQSLQRVNVWEWNLGLLLANGGYLIGHHHLLLPDRGDTPAENGRREEEEKGEQENLVGMPLNIFLLPMLLHQAFSSYLNNCRHPDRAPKGAPLR